MNLLGRRKRNTEPAAPERIDLIPGAPESALGRCYCCGTSWKWVYSHSTPYGDEGRGCFPLCEACWTKLTPAERLPYYSMLMAEWVRQLGPTQNEKWPEIKAAVEAGL